MEKELEDYFLGKQHRVIIIIFGMELMSREIRPHQGFTISKSLENPHKSGDL